MVLISYYSGILVISYQTIPTSCTYQHIFSNENQHTLSNKTKISNLMLFQVLGQEVLDKLLLFGRRCINGWVLRLGGTPWLWSSNKHNCTQGSESQHVGLNGSSENLVCGTHDEVVVDGEKFVDEVRLYWLLAVCRVESI